MIRLITLLCSSFYIFLQLSGSLSAQDTARYEWDLTDIYADASDWQSALDQVALRITEFQNLRKSSLPSADMM